MEERCPTPLSPNGTPPGWVASVTAESVADCSLLVQALENAALEPDGHVPKSLAALAAQARQAARHSSELRELTQTLTAQQQELLSHQLLLLVAAAMRGRNHPGWMRCER
jgi:hypothetical protein